MTSAPGPLTGVRVLELGTMYAAPTAGRMLRDFGADVTKVEDPGTGDFARHWTPQKDGLSLGFARLNAGKRSTAIDLRRDEDAIWSGGWPPRSTWCSSRSGPAAWKPGAWTTAPCPGTTRA